MKQQLNSSAEKNLVAYTLKVSTLKTSTLKMSTLNCKKNNSDE